MGYKKGVTFRTAFDTYAVDEQIGVGGSGEVYAVRDSDGSAFALKVLDQGKATTARLKRFKNEIHFCSKSLHANVIRVRDSGVTPTGATFYVMPVYPVTLRKLIGDGIAVNEVLSYFGKILDGVEAAHLCGTWHRDLKPENILASPPTEVVVADFGVAHFEEEDLLTAVETQNNERLANFQYSAPEQRSRGQKVDSKADVFALGQILNEMFTGAVPHGTGFRKISEFSSNHAYLDSLVDDMLRQDPAHRPSIADVKRDLIARGNLFLSVQHLNAMRSQVIPETEVDDPIIRNPITLVDVDYQDGTFIFTLSAVPPPIWIAGFQKPRVGSWGSIWGAGPEYFSFNGNRARVGLNSATQGQQLVNYTKSYIDMANRQYAETVVAEHRKKLAAQREHLRQDVEAEERRQKILAGIKI